MHEETHHPGGGGLARPRTVRAADVLPEALVVELQAHVQACFIYVPSARPASRAGRDQSIVAARAAGARVREVAHQFGLTERRVGQILARARRAVAS